MIFLLTGRSFHCHSEMISLLAFNARCQVAIYGDYVQFDQTTDNTNITTFLDVQSLPLSWSYLDFHLYISPDSNASIKYSNAVG